MFLSAPCRSGKFGIDFAHFHYAGSPAELKFDSEQEELSPKKKHQPFVEAENDKLLRDNQHSVPLIIRSSVDEPAMGQGYGKVSFHHGLPGQSMSWTT